jgi:hypothetical protein
VVARPAVRGATSASIGTIGSLGSSNDSDIAKTHAKGSWILIATVIALGIGTMVFLTLR